MDRGAFTFRGGLRGKGGSKIYILYILPCMRII